MRACLIAIMCIVAFHGLYAQSLIWRKYNPWNRVFYGLSIQPDGRVCVSVDSIIYIGSRGLVTWDSIKSPLMQNRRILAQKLILRTNGDLYLTNDAMGLYRSSDNGQSWEGSLVNEGCESVAFNMDGVVFAGISYTGNGKAHRSRTNCASWQAIPLPNLPGYPTLGYVFQGSNTVFAQTISGIFKSVDTGSTWSSVGITASAVRAQTLCQSLDGKLFVIAGQKIVRSLDNGSTWTEVMPSGLPANTYFVYLACGADKQLYAASSTKIFRSADNGDNWQQVFTTVQFANINYLQADDKGYLYVGTYREVFQAYIGLDPALYSLQFPLKITNGSENTSQLNIGFAASASSGVDDLLGEFQLPVTVPVGTFDARLALPVSSSTYCLSDFRNDTVKTAVWKVVVQKGTPSQPVVITWNPGLLPAGNFYLYDSVTATTVNMKSDSAYSVNRAGIIALQLQYSALYSAAMQMVAGWNMVSVPVQSGQMTAGTVFNGASSSVFGFLGGYSPVQNLQNGTGYWVNYPAAATIQINGNAILAKSIQVHAGWNLIGVFENTVPAGSISSVPQGIIASSFFGFQAGYYPATELNSGKGYWVFVNQAGTLLCNQGTAEKNTVTRIKHENNSKARIEFSDAAGNTITLYHQERPDISSALPPLPPAGVFDIRFASDRHSENLDKGAIVTINNAVYPVTVTVYNMDVTLTDNETHGKLINNAIQSGQSLQISENKISELTIKREQSKNTFALLQNYPNPFNPVCRIAYQIDVKSPVTLTVFTIQGEEIAKLVNRVQEPGFYTIDFDGAKLNSGVYFYTLVSGGNSSTKKMLLLK